MKFGSGAWCAVAFSVASLHALPARAVTFDYCDFSNVSTLKLNLDASQQMNTLLLTRDVMDQIGSAFHTTPVPWSATTSFHTFFSFELSPSATGADGIAFVLQNSAAGDAALGKNGGAVGYGDDDGVGAVNGGIGKSLIVEFDTYENSWDPNSNHVGIMENADNANHLAHGTPSFTMAGGGKLYAWIDYAAPTTTLNVYLAQSATKPASPLVSYSGLNVASTVGAQAFAGFTGSTGGSTNLQQIFEWEFSTDGVSCGCGGNTDCSGSTPYCAPAGDPKADLCVACVTDAECDSSQNTATPICTKSGADVDTCVACSTNSDCASAGLAPVCATSGGFLGQCVTCVTNSDCASNPTGPVCLAEAATSACVQCGSDANCSGATPVCDTTSHTCGPCQLDSDCSGATPACQTSGPLAGRCTQCSSSNVTACPTESVCDSQTGTCMEIPDAGSSIDGSTGDGATQSDAGHPSEAGLADAATDAAANDAAPTDSSPGDAQGLNDAEGLADAEGLRDAERVTDAAPGDGGPIAEASGTDGGMLADGSLDGSMSVTGEDAAGEDAQASEDANSGGAVIGTGQPGDIGGGGCACSAPGGAPGGRGDPFALLVLVAALAARRKDRS
jgi:MYXO-CTERM domain-containing protein